jgi:hypothetical protein
MGQRNLTFQFGQHFSRVGTSFFGECVAPPSVPLIPCRERFPTARTGRGLLRYFMLTFSTRSHFLVL